MANMKSFSTTTVIEAPMASNRRQPVRQTRTNPARTATNPLPSRGSVGGPQDNAPVANPGFCPAITHFTDSIAALPKEMVRHYTMLKEVDAKVHGPEEIVKELVKTALRSPVPPRGPASGSQTIKSSRLNSGAFLYTAGLTKNRSDSNAQQQEQAPAQPQPQENPDPADLPRRHLFRNIRMVMSEMLMTVDEKNHVLSTAIDGLDKQLMRCESSYPYIENEVSEEARYGSLNHWAYHEKPAEKKGTTAGERTRREAAAAHQLASANHEVDEVALRSELRREAVAARKRNQHLDSDFDDRHSTAKKAQGIGKGRRAAEPAFTAINAAVGLGIAADSHATAPPIKRRKLEKSNPGSALGEVPMDRALSTVYGPNGTSARGNAGSPKETPAEEAAKKRGRGAAAANGTGRRRYEDLLSRDVFWTDSVSCRTNTNTSVANSPLMVSSPVVGTFPTSHHKSPVPSILQRAQPSRARQNSNQSAPQVRPSSSTSNMVMNGNGLFSTTADVNKVARLTGRSIGDVKTSMRESVNTKGEHLIEDATDGAGDMRGALVVGGKSDRSEREGKENGTSKSGRSERPRSISVSTRKGGKTSKTSTPLNASFSEPQRSRPSRTIELTAKRSHKKGAGLAAQLAAAAAAHDEEGSSMQGDEDEDDEETEPTYCYCNQVSYGAMVACDMSSCKKEWFHLDCVGLAKAPTKNGQWTCKLFRLIQANRKLTHLFL